MKTVEQKELNEHKKIKESEKTSIREGSFFGVMEGFGVRYITPYALALGATNLIVGLISTLPGFLGNLTQLYTTQLIKKKSRKSLVFFAILMQALLWIPLIFVGVLYYFYPAIREYLPWMLLTIYSLLIIFGSSAGPAWNSWMKDLIVKNSGKYFGIRNMIVNMVTIISMLIAGFILTFFTNGKVLIGFFIIFFIAFLGRFISSLLILKQYEPRFTYDDASYFTFRQFIKGMLYNNFGRFVFLVSAMSFATFLAGPFITVYILEDLKLTYFQFTIISVSSVLSAILFLPLWGNFADKFGNIKVIKITSLFISLIPLLWFFSIYLNMLPFLAFFSFLIFIELFAGLVWAGFNLSASMFIYDAVTKQKMMFCIAYFNIINSLGAFFGAVLGGYLSSNYPHFFGVKAVIILFIASFILNLLFSLFIQRGVREVREVKKFKLDEFIKNIEKRFLGMLSGYKSMRVENF